MHARDLDLIGDLVLRMHEGGGRAAERAADVVGVLTSPLFAAVSSLRRARALYARGDCADADVWVAGGVPARSRALAERLSGNAFVRLSDALARSRARWPDVLGCAIRFGGAADDPALEGDQDLLLATVRRPWTMPLSPFRTHVRDYFANDYFGVCPFSVTGEPRPIYFRLRPASREPDAVTTIDEPRGPASSLRASTSKARRSRAEQRRRRFERAVASGQATFTLGTSPSPWGPFAPLVVLQLVSVRLTDPPGLRFDPFRSGRGIEPRGFVHALRRGAYAASQRAREARLSARR